MENISYNNSFIKNYTIYRIFTSLKEHVESNGLNSEFLVERIEQFIDFFIKRENQLHIIEQFSESKISAEDLCIIFNAVEILLKHGDDSEKNLFVHYFDKHATNIEQTITLSKNIIESEKIAESGGKIDFSLEEYDAFCINACKYPTLSKKETCATTTKEQFNYCSRFRLRIAPVDPEIESYIDSISTCSSKENSHLMRQVRQTENKNHSR